MSLSSLSSLCSRISFWNSAVSAMTSGSVMRMDSSSKRPSTASSWRAMRSCSLKVGFSCIYLLLAQTTRGMPFKSR